MANIMRFVILGDDRGGPAFASFTKQVEKANAAVDRNNAALKRQGTAAAQARTGLAGLAGEVTGFGAAADAASSGGNKFKLALAGINLASGVLEPALAGVVVAAGGLAAGLAAAGAGLGAFGLVAKANFTAASTAATAATAAQDAHTAAVAKVTGQYQYAMSVAKTRAQRQAAYAAEQKGFNTAELAQTAALNKAYAGLTPAQVGMAKQISGMKTQWQKFTASFAPMLNQMLGVVRPVFGIILKDIGMLARAGGTAIQALLPSLGVAIGSSGFQKFIKMLATNAAPAIVKIGVAVGHVVVGIGGILKAFMPMSQGMLTGLDKITAKFAEWGKSLGSGTGFKSLMTTFREETPQAVAILKNLGVVIGNVGKAMFGLSSFSNSKSLLAWLLSASGIMASLSKNTDLVRVALYALLAVKIGQQFSWVTDAWKGLVKFAAAAEGATVAETIAAAATRAWGLAMAALPWVALAAAVIAVAVLIIKYHRQIWAFIQKVWHDVLAVIRAVWTWVKRNWPLLLAVITGPVGLAILWIVRNFGRITDAVKVVLKAVKTAWDAAWGALKTAFRIFIVNGILTPIGWIIHAAAAAFGWVPGLGGKLKGAAKAFDKFKQDVNKSLGGINGRTVHVGVAMTSSTNPYPGGISGRKAAGGRITGPGGPRDDRAGLYALSNNEWVIRADSAARYGHKAMQAVNEGRAYIGYAGGGVAVKTSAPGPAAIESSLMASVTKLAKAFAAAASAVTAVRVPNAGSGVMRWAPLVLQALKMEGLGSYLASQVLYQMMTESGGNPNAINLTDINAQRGDPSRGLLQTIGSTFSRWHWPGTSWNIYDPLANIAAAINYARHTYGPSLMSGGMGMGSGHGYDQGGYLPTGWSLAYNGTGRPEPVGPAIGGGGNTYNITVNVPPTASKADTGRVIVEHIRAYEQGSGSRWRK